MTENTNETNDKMTPEMELIFQTLSAILSSLQPLLARELVLRDADDQADQIMWSTQYLQKVMVDNVRCSGLLIRKLMPEEYSRVKADFEEAVRNMTLQDFLSKQAPADEDEDKQIEEHLRKLFFPD